MSYDFRREYEATTPRKQGTCGGCGSFAVSSALSDRLRRVNPQSPELSCALPLIGDTGRHDMLVRSDAPNSLEAQRKLSELKSVNGCDGTTLRKAWRYLWVFGTPSDAQLPIERVINWYHNYGRLPHIQTMLGAGTNVGVDGRELQVYRPLNVYDVPPELITQEIRLRGPVTAAFYAPPDFYDWDGSGVYDCNSYDGERTAHAVRVVGYTPDTWIAANSWGSEWGDRGYFHIHRNCPRCQFEHFVQGANVVGGNVSPLPTEVYPGLYVQARMRWTVFAGLNDEPRLPMYESGTNKSTSYIPVIAVVLVVTVMVWWLLKKDVL